MCRQSCGVGFFFIVVADVLCFFFFFMPTDVNRHQLTLMLTVQ